MPEMADEGSTRRVRNGFWLLIAAVVLILIMGDLNRRMSDARRLEVAALQLSTEVADLETQGAELNTAIAESTSEPNIARWAREQAKLVRPGEILILPMPIPGETLTAEAPLTMIDPPASRFEVWWALLFGSRP